MSRINLRFFKLSWWQWLLGLILIWLVFVIWPIKGLLWPGNWWGQSLIVVMNDNEARPCGGFATAYGELSLPLLSFDVGNSYELQADLGPAPEPLDQVSDRLYFWDLGQSLNLAQCAEDFAAGYRANVDDVDRVILLPLSFLERWADLFGDTDFFAEITRKVANVDRHDEAALAGRKNSSAGLMKSLFVSSALTPWNWGRITNLVGKYEHRNQLFWQGYSKHSPAGDTLISIAEWNLGGGKSSRYLRRQADIDLRETEPGRWEAVITLNIAHLGGYDEPLSQVWKGGFVVNVFGASQFLEIELDPGQTWLKTHYFPLETPPTKAEIHTPPLQDWETNFSVSAVPGQTLQSDTLKITESVGRSKTHRQHRHKTISWNISSDQSAPFLTLHKPIDPNVIDAEVRQELNWEADDLITEIHFNEAVEIDSFSATLTDRNFAETDIDENPQLKAWTLLDDQVTMLLNWSQNEYQTDERFYLSLEGVTDIWGNQYENPLRTVITR